MSQSSGSGPRQKVLVTRNQLPEAIARLETAADVTVLDDPAPPTADELKAAIAGHSGIFAHITDSVDGDAMDAAGSALKVIAEFGVGYDNIDLAAASERGIAVGNTPGILSETTADLTFALMLSAARRIAEGDRFARGGSWKWFDPLYLLGADIHHATLGIIGFGRIGKEMAKRARGFDMRVIYFSRSQPADDLGAERVATLDDLLAQADFVTIHCPLTPETHGLISAPQLARMKSTAVLVNAARGPIVDSKALYEALRDGEIAYAALDVTDPEPPPADDPLLTLDTVTTVPHIGSASIGTRMKMATMTVDNILAGLKGELPPNCVNSDRLSWG